MCPEVYLDSDPRHSFNNYFEVSYSNQRALLLCIAYYELRDDTAAALVLRPHYKMRWLEEHWKQHPQWIAAAKAVVVELFNDYKRRHPDEVLASPGRSQHSNYMREFDRYNTLTTPIKATSLSAISVKSVSHGTLIHCGCGTQQRAVVSPDACWLPIREYAADALQHTKIPVGPPPVSKGKSVPSANSISSKKNSLPVLCQLWHASSFQ